MSWSRAKHEHRSCIAREICSTSLILEWRVGKTVPSVKERTVAMNPRFALPEGRRRGREGCLRPPKTSSTIPKRTGAPGMKLPRSAMPNSLPQRFSQGEFDARCTRGASRWRVEGASPAPSPVRDWGRFVPSQDISHLRHNHSNLCHQCNQSVACTAQCIGVISPLFASL